MTPEEWQRVRPILESALELDPASRASFLDVACADSFVRREAESLINSHEQAGTHALNPVSSPILNPDEETRFRLPSGRRVGPYEIVGEIAQGGMGAVYRAIRADGQYKQQVALKIVRSDLGAELTGTRFRNERQILASLDHPNIAKILDGGTTVDGLPYFVMELIDGLPITEYGDQHKLPIDARLKIFRTVCSAVHYAHQRLVIHRDIKPSNILVTTDGIPKLLDFGIAKILDPSLLPENMTMTAAGLWMMTPEYASPEQLRGEAITTATDVYSLGLVLYQLLAGHRAYRFASPMPHEIARVVLETEPEKPSTAIRRKEHAAEEKPKSVMLTPEIISGQRSDSPEKLPGRIVGDLDNIVMKAIRKDPRERYNSADQLSEDIRRHLEHLPVLARKSTVVYRCRKYVLRHKVGVAAAALVFLSLLTGIALTLREARIARANQLRAEQRFNDVRQLANSLVFDLHDAVQDLPGSTTARYLIVTNAIEYLDRLSADAGDDLSLKRELAAAYLKLGTIQGNAITGNLGDAQAARQSYLKAVSILESLLVRSPDVSAIQRQLAAAYGRVGDVTSDPASLEYYKKSLDLRERLSSLVPNDAKLAGELAQSYQTIAGVMITSRNFKAAKDASQKSLAEAQRYYDANPHGRDETETLSISYTKFGISLEMLEEYDAALAVHTRALKLDRQLAFANPDSPSLQRNVAIDFDRLGHVKMSRKDTGKDALSALADFHSAIAIFEKITLADPADKRTSYLLAVAHEYAGSALLEAKRYGSALKEYREALSVCRCSSGWDTKNDRPARLAGNIYKMIGDSYEALARSATSPSSGYLTSACSNYHNSIAAFDFLQSIGSSTAFDQEIQRDVSLQMAQCSAITR
jgi:eukaryotic-like serine/threonine-protein kinase